jgi:hypothetical protein
MILHTFFEEESNLIAALQEIAVANVVALLTSREFGHRMVVKREVIE